jgi:tetratricopeptide (TPR) repeat protein
MRASRLAQVAVFCVDELGQEVAARGFFEEALTVDPAQPVALVRLADIAWASRDDERALELLDRLSPEAWLAAPTDDGRARTLPELLMRRARCAWALGRADTRDRLRQVLRADARHVAALELLARLALDAQDDDGAEHALESLTQAIVPADDPVRLATTLLDLAGLRLRRGHPGEAVVAAERALELNPTSLAVLEMVGEAREAAGRHAEAAEAWRRVAALRSGPDRVRALERRVGALQAAQRFRETIDALLDLFGETGDPRHKAAAADVARQSGQHDLLQRVGATVETPRPALEPPEDTTRTQAMPVAPGIGGALVIQLRANLDAGDAARALTLAQAAQVGGPLDAESTRLAIEAAGRVGAWAEAVAMAEARLQTATEPAEVLGLALAAGRTARDHLHDDDRAAALLYQAHQADAEDIEVRLELTSLYARIPRLASHAVTGILQLLRRTPTDARVFGLAAELAEQQGQAERAIAMRGIAAVLKGSAIPQELMLGRVAEERTTAAIMPMDREAIGSRLAPTGWGSPLQQLITLLGVHLEVALGGPPPPPGAKPLVQASPRSAAMMERVDRLLPGRTVQVVMADVDRPTVCAGGVPQVVVPRDVLVHDGALAATIARGVAVVRLGALLTETVKPGREQEVLDLLRAGLLGEGSRDARSELLTARLQPDEKAAAVALARQVFSQPIDLAATLQIMSRACDRFVLVATGSAVAALQASALPTLMKEPPQRAMLLVQGSVRALELCAFAARDNAWLLRRQHLL